MNAIEVHVKFTRFYKETLIPRERSQSVLINRIVWERSNRPPFGVRSKTVKERSNVKDLKRNHKRIRIIKRRLPH